MSKRDRPSIASREARNTRAPAPLTKQQYRAALRRLQVELTKLQPGKPSVTQITVH